MITVVNNKVEEKQHSFKNFNRYQIQIMLQQHNKNLTLVNILKQENRTEYKTESQT